MIANQLRSAYLGTTALEIQRGAESYDVDVRLLAEDRNSLADLDYFVVTTAQGAQIPLSVVASLEQARGYARINRIDGQRTVTIQGEVNVKQANASAIVGDAIAQFSSLLATDYPGVTLALEGQNKEAATTQKSMASGFILGLIGVYLLLSFQFRSYLEPIVVMVAIPLAIIGVIWGHLLMGLDISMPSMLGFVSLAGVVVNNSILLVEFTKKRCRTGTPIAEAASLASQGRFRAIFLTSLTTLLGLFPILTETSIQAQILIPLVTSLVFGLLASTVLVLGVVPALYVILDDLGLSTLARQRKADSINAEEKVVS